MEIHFSSKKMYKICSNPKEMVKTFGHECAKKLHQRLMDIRAAESLADLFTLPGARCHQLTQNRDNQFAVDLKHPYRLIFEPFHDPMPLTDYGGFDIDEITSVLIIEVVDYHGN